ncbi:MAG: SDR family oxidoreductase [Pseudomonadota bacterium]|nr:SDR family oxidoreductase [Pseudomonadota bacterium]
MPTLSLAETSKVAIITGANRGLGHATAVALAKRGVDIIFTFHSHKDEAEKVAAEIEALGRKAALFQLDTGAIGAFDTFAGQVRQTLGDWGRDRFDHLVNNAGIGISAPFAETTETQFDALMVVQFKGVFFLTQKLLPLLADGGRIVNISSGLTRATQPGMSAYASMKGAIEVFTRYLAKELGARGIAVNAVAPGAIETDFGGGGVRDNEQVNKFIASQTAMGRVGVPEDIGPMIASLLADDNRWVTGQRIEVSGGMFL